MVLHVAPLTGPGMTSVSPTLTSHTAWGSVLEEALPAYDMVLTEHPVVEADVDTVFATARDFDFMTVQSPLVTAMMTARALPSRLRGRVLESPTRLGLASEPGALPGWLILGQVPGRELAFGAIGRFWTADILAISGALCLTGITGAVTGDMNVRDIGIVGYAVVLPVALPLQGRRFATTVPPETAA